MDLSSKLKFYSCLLFQRIGIQNVITHVESRDTMGLTCRPEIVEGINYLRCNVADDNVSAGMTRS